MLLAVDIGNSNIKFGIFEGDRLLSKFSLPTNSKISDADLRSKIGEFPITRAVVCSVVPGKEISLRNALNEAFGTDSVIVTNDLDLGLKINYEPISALGTDRVVNSFAA